MPTFRQGKEMWKSLEETLISDAKLSREERRKDEEVYKQIQEAKNATLSIICPYCRASYSAQMMEDFEGSNACDTCGPTNKAIIDIYCSNCEKLVYRKETDVW